MPITIRDVNTRAEEVRDGLHAFGTKHPFTFGAITLVVGFILGFIIG